MPKKQRKGFRLPERIVTLVFEDEDGPYAGLEIDVSVTARLGYFFKIAEWADLPEDQTPDVGGIRASMQEWAADHLRGWNLEDNRGAAVPATPDAFTDRIDVTTQALIVRRWMKAVSQPPPEASPPSPAGGTSVAETTTSR